MACRLSVGRCSVGQDAGPSLQGAGRPLECYGCWPIVWPLDLVIADWIQTYPLLLLRASQATFGRRTTSLSTSHLYLDRGHAELTTSESATPNVFTLPLCTVVPTWLRRSLLWSVRGCGETTPAGKDSISEHSAIDM
jgi:hypothetical protein